MPEKGYGHKESVVFSYVQELLTIEVSEQLLIFWDVLNVHLCFLAAQGKTSDKFGVLLMPMVVSKLYETHMEWARGSEGKEDDLSTCWSFWTWRSIVRKDSDDLKLHPRSLTPPKVKHKDNQGSAPALQTSSSGNVASTSSGKCVFCSNSNHLNVRCTQYLDADIKDRYEMLKQARLGFKCISLEHRAAKCCQRCNYMCLQQGK